MGIECKACKSKNMHTVEGELTISLVGLKGLKVPPVYVCQSVLICVACGFAELVIPPDELQSIEKGITTLNS